MIVIVESLLVGHDFSTAWPIPRESPQNRASLFYESPNLPARMRIDISRYGILDFVSLMS